MQTPGAIRVLAFRQGSRSSSDSRAWRAACSTECSSWLCCPLEVSEGKTDEISIFPQLLGHDPLAKPGMRLFQRIFALFCFSSSRLSHPGQLWLQTKAFTHHSLNTGPVGDSWEAPDYWQKNSSRSKFLSRWWQCLDHRDPEEGILIGWPDVLFLSGPGSPISLG